jgi:hypothetical protein
MRVAVSPYHLTTREPAAVTAFLLGSSVVTMLPAPLSGGERERAERVAFRVPRYLDFMESWRWTVPLWSEGVIGAEWDGDVAADEVRAVWDLIAGDERLRPLRGLMRPQAFASDEAFLDAMAADLLKGGPDPSFTVPVAAGLDRFASRHGIVVVRSEPVSLVQKAEERLGRRVFVVAIPVLLQASAHGFLAARGLLEEELDGLRSAIAALADVAERGDSNGHISAAERGLSVASKAYAGAFEANREAILRPEGRDEDDVRTVDGMVTITGMFMPMDAALVSSLSAVRTLAPSLGSAQASSSSLPVPVKQARDVFTLLVKVMGRPAKR